MRLWYYVLGLWFASSFKLATAATVPGPVGPVGYGAGRRREGGEEEEYENSKGSPILVAYDSHTKMTLVEFVGNKRGHGIFGKETQAI